MKVLICVLLFTCVLSAQITTATFSSGIEINGEPGKNLKITLIHLPTNYVYTTVSDKHGNFSLDNLDVGGPYKLIIEIDDKRKFTKTYDYLLLGDNDINKIRI